MKVSVILLVFLTSFSSIFAQSQQDSIILLNGKVFKGEITGSDEFYLKYKEVDRKGSIYESQIELYRIFSYTKNNTETVLYQQNEELDNYLTVKEAKHATLGSYDARQTFKPRFVFWSSAVLGFGATIWDTYLLDKTIQHEFYAGSHTTPGFFKSEPSLFPVIVPLVLTVGWSFPSFKVKQDQMIQKHLLNDADYYRGFHRIAKQKRMLGALKGSLVGIGAGLITYAVFKP